MIVYAVKKRVRFDDLPDVKAIQSVSFHGDAFRHSANDRWTAVALGQRKVDPMHLIRDGHRVPYITSPRLGLVVSDPVKSVLGTFRNIEFLPVVVDRLVDFYVPDGDFSMYEERNDFDHWEKLRNASLFESKETKDLHLHEVVMADQPDLTERSTPTHAAILDFPELGSTKPAFATSIKLLEEYPLQFCERCFVMVPQVFAALELFFDWRFYIKRRLVLEPK